MKNFLLVFIISLILLVNVESLDLLSVNGYVRTVGGWTREDCAHKVPSGSYVVGKDNSFLIYQFNEQLNQLEEEPIVAVCDVEKDTRKVHLTNLEFMNLLVQAPLPLIHNGDKEKYSDKMILEEARRVIDSSQDQAEGWQSYSIFESQNQETFTSFTSYFNTPLDPVAFEDFMAVDFLFPALENEAGFEIIQPVIQYGGGSSAGGGKYWALASWYVTDGAGTIYTNITQIEENDIIFGNMTQHPDTPKTWFIGGRVVGKDINVDLTVNRNTLVNQPAAYCTYEAYSFSNCGSIPGSNYNCYNMTLTQKDNNNVVPQWVSMQGPPVCDTQAIINDPYNVTIQMGSGSQSTPFSTLH